VGLRIVSSRFSRWERAMAGAVVLVAAAVLFLGAPGEAAASQFCTWYLHCVVTCDPNDPNNCGTECTITGYWCQPSQGDCESICDEEQLFCEQDCIDEGGTQLDCGRMCRVIFRECNKSCVPSL